MPHFVNISLATSAIIAMVYFNPGMYFNPTDGEFLYAWGKRQKNREYSHSFRVWAVGLDEGGSFLQLSLC